MFIFAGLMSLLFAGALALTPIDADMNESYDDDTPPADPEDPPLVDVAKLMEGVENTTEGLAGSGGDGVTAPVTQAAGVQLFSKDSFLPNESGQGDPIDQVYGKNISDTSGANLFGRLLVSDPAILGTEQSDDLVGGDGKDWLVGNGSDDTLAGGAGADLITGDAGDDQLYGNFGNDILDGGSGDDRLSGGAAHDLVMGGDGDDLVEGNDGNDRIFGQLGNDTLMGGAGNDILDGTHASNIETAWDEADDADLLIGGAGDDVLVLGNGDVATGGEGADEFVSGLYADESAPSITDFDVLEDELVLGLRTGDVLPDLDTEVDEDGVSVLLDGIEVAYLEGISELPLSAVRFVSLQL